MMIVKRGRARWFSRPVVWILVLLLASLAGCSEPAPAKTPDTGPSAGSPQGNQQATAPVPGTTRSTSVESGVGSLKLNPALPVDGDVTEQFKITSDGQRLVYIADQTTNDVNELYSVGLNGGAAVKLNAPLAARTHVQGFQVSADGKYAVYYVRGAKEFDIAIYSVPVSGGPANKLTPALYDTTRLDWYSITPDSSRVIYLTQFQDNESAEIYSVPIGGGTPVRLSQVGNDEASMSADNDFKISPDSRYVVFREDGILFAVPPAGGTPVRMAETSDVENFKITPDSKRVVYRARADDEDSYADLLFSVAITGGASTNISGKLTGSGVTDPNRGEESFRITADSTRVIFLARQEDAPYELYSAMVSGAGSAIKLNAPVQTDGNVGEYVLSPDSRYVVYGADAERDDIYDIYSVPAAGGQAIRLNKLLDPNGTRTVSKYSISPDSKRVVYIAWVAGSGQPDLYRVAIGGPDSSAVQLNTARPYQTRHQAVDFLIGPDSSQVIYREQSQRPSGSADTFYILPPWVMSVPLLGGTPKELAGSAPSISAYQLTPDGKRVVYLSDKDSTKDHPSEYNLYITASVPK